MSRITNIGVYDYNRNKLCDLYDSAGHIDGQAYKISWTRNIDGIPSLSFTIPYRIDQERNFRWKYMRSEYQIRMVRGDKIEWFIASKPVKSKSNKEIVGTVTCNGLAAILKTKNIYMTFDTDASDPDAVNGVGTVDYLMTQILNGTGWHLGFCETMLEPDGVTEMVRSLQCDGKKGALDLINTTCNLFKCYPIYDSDKMEVNIYSLQRHDKLIELTVGRNVNTLSVTNNSDDIVTRMNVEGEYGDYGYVGIDDVNPTGLNYIMNFDYYRELGLFTAEHEAALSQYYTDILNIRTAISNNQALMTDLMNDINTYIGQCVVSVYFSDSGFGVPAITYGSPTPDQKKLAQGDEVVILKNDTTYRYATIEGSPASMLESGEYGIVKFATPSAGLIGSKEVQIEAKQKQIDNLTTKKEASFKPETIAEYEAEIEALEDEIDDIYTGDATTNPDKIKETAKAYIPAGYDGDVDLTNRRIIPGQTMYNAGYTSFTSADYATLYSITLGPFSYNSKKYLIVATPIKSDGNVLTESQIENYIDDLVDNAGTNHRTVMEYDDLNLVLMEREVRDGETDTYAITKVDKWANDLHKMQAKWDIVRAKNNWFGQDHSVVDPGGYFEDIRGKYTEGLYEMMFNVVDRNGLLADLQEKEAIASELDDDQLDIEADFIVAMGDMLRDGYWSNNNYVPGQEQSLYNDALKMSDKMGKPKISYSLQYLRAPECDMEMDDMEINMIAHLVDDELDVNEYLYMRKITIGIDEENSGSIEVNNDEVTITGNDLGTILSRMSQLSDLIEQKNALYERAKAISKSGSIFADRLNGQIDVLKNQLLSTVSNWSTDENGNIIFLNVDGSSAMMLCGAGFMIANSKDDNGEWRWRTFGTGEGFTADEIVAGFISADRIEAGTIAVSKLVPNAGSDLDISGNSVIAPPDFNTTKDYVVGQMVTYNGKYYRFKANHPKGAWDASHVEEASLGTAIDLVPGMITTTITDELGNYYTKTETASYISTAIEDNNGNYYTKEETASRISTTISNSLGNYYNKEETASIIRTTVSSAMGEYYTKEETASMIRTTVSSEMGNYYTKTETASYVASEMANTNRTFIQLTDPTLDNEVKVGDWWCKADLSTWRELGELTWRQIQEQDIGVYMGGETFVWDGYEWVPRSNIGEETRNRTMILQTQSYVSLLAQTISSYDGTMSALEAEFRLTSSQISAEVRRATQAESQKVSVTGTYQTAESIVTAAQMFTDSRLTNYYNRTETASYVLETLSAFSGNYYTRTETDSQVTTTLSTALGNYYTKDETNSRVSTTISNSLGNYYTKEETDSKVSETITDAMGNYYTRTATNDRIETRISSVIGNYYTKEETESKVTTTISSSLGNYYTKSETDDKISTTISTTIGNYYTKEETDSKVSTTISTALGGYYTKTETDSKVTTTISDALGNYYTKTETNSKISFTLSNVYEQVSGIEITASGIDISGSQYVKIASGGYFKVTTGDFTINTQTSSDTDYVMWSGASSASTAPFRLKKNGELYITKLYSVDDQGAASQVNFGTALWKLYYRTVKTFTASTDGGVTTLTLGCAGGDLSVNFNSAASVYVEAARVASWSSSYSSIWTVEVDLSSGSTLTVNLGDTFTPLRAVHDAGAAYADSLYTHLGTRELGYMDHGNFESVGNHNWYYK